MNFKSLFKGKLDLTDSIKNYVEQAVTQTQQSAAQATQAAQAATPQASAPAQTTGRGFEPIAGVSLEQYVHLLVNMIEVGEDAAKCVAVAEANGVARDAWVAAKDGWTARMEDPELGSVRTAFVQLYAEALDRKRDGKEPLPLETFVRVFAETSFRKDPNDAAKPLDREVVLREHNLSVNQWNEALYYWSPKVSDQHHPVYKKYAALLKQESDRIRASIHA